MQLYRCGFSLLALNLLVLLEKDATQMLEDCVMGMITIAKKCLGGITILCDLEGRPSFGEVQEARIELGSGKDTE